MAKRNPFEEEARRARSRRWMDWFSMDRWWHFGEKWFFKVYDWFEVRIQDMGYWLVSLLRLRGWVRTVGWILSAPIRLFWSVIFLFEMAISRLSLSARPIDLVYGLPAFLFATAFFWVLLFAFIQPTNQLRERYRRAGERAYAVKDPAGAQLAFENSIRFGEDDPEVKYHLALVRAQQDPDDARREAEIRAVAEMGYTRAHTWLAERMLRNYRNRAFDMSPEERAELLERVWPHLEKSLEGDSNHAEVLYWVGQYHMQKGDTREALRNFRLALSADQSGEYRNRHPLNDVLRIDTNRMIAQCYQLLNDPNSQRMYIERARDLCQNNVTAFPELHDQRRLWALCLADLGQVDQAISVLLDGRERFPDDLLTAELLGNLTYTQALTLPTTEPKNTRKRTMYWKESIRAYTQLLDQRGENPVLERRVAEAHWNLGQLDAADPLVRKLAKEPEKYPEMAVFVALLDLQAGNREAGLEALDRARQPIRPAIVRVPQFRLFWISTLLRFGLLEEAARETEEGLAQIRTVRVPGKDLSPLIAAYEKARTEVMMLRAAAMEESGEANLEELFELHRRTLQADPTNVVLLRRLVNWSRDSDDRGQMSRTLLEELPKRMEKPAKYFVTLGTIHYQLGDLGRAERYYAHAMELEPFNPEAVNNLAYILAIKDPPELERGFALLDPFMQRNSEYRSHPECRHTRGLIHMKLGRFDEAIEDFRAALEVMPNNGYLVDDMIEAATKAGKSDLAARYREHRSMIKDNVALARDVLTKRANEKPDVIPPLDDEPGDSSTDSAAPAKSRPLGVDVPLTPSLPDIVTTEDLDKAMARLQAILRNRESTTEEKQAALEHVKRVRATLEKQRVVPRSRRPIQTDP